MSTAIESETQAPDAAESENNAPIESTAANEVASSQEAAAPSQAELLAGKPFDSLSESELNALIDNPGLLEEIQAAAKTDAAPQVEAVEQPAAVAETPEEDPEGDPANFTKNFRLTADSPERSAFLKILRSEPGVDPISAALRAGYKLPESVAPAAASPQPAEAAAASDPFAEIRAEIAELEERRKAARSAYSDKEADDLSEQIWEKRDEIKRRTQEMAEAASHQERFQAALTQSFDALVAEFGPAARDISTPLGQEIDREQAWLEVNAPQFFDDPDFPVALARRVMERRPDLAGNTPPKAPTQPKPNQPPAVTPRQPARAAQVVPATASTQSAAPTLDDVRKYLANADPVQLDRLVDAVGQKPQEALERW